MLQRLSEKEYFKLEFFLHIDPLSNPFGQRIILERETLSILYRTISRIPSELRQVSILSYLEHFSTEEIADLTGLGVKTIESALHHARQLIRKELITCAIRENIVL